MPPKKKKNSTARDSAKKGKRKDPPPAARSAKKNKSSIPKSKESGRKRQKAGEKKIVADLKRRKQEETFYFCESNDSAESCNLLLQKLLVRQPSKATTNNREGFAPFEFSSGTDTNGRIYSSSDGRTIEANESNLLVAGLNSGEVRMWSSCLGANYASKGFAPGNIARKIGTITRQLWITSDAIDEPNQIPLCTNHHPLRNQRTMKCNNNAKANPPSITKAKKEIMKSNTDFFESCSTEEEREQLLLDSATELVDAWKKSLNRVGKFLPNWTYHGEIPIVPVMKEVSTEDNISTNKKQKKRKKEALKTTSISSIRSMLELNVWLDDTEFASTEKELYHLKIPTDTLSVLRALEELALPNNELYRLPLVVAIPILEPPVATSCGNAGTPELESRSLWRLTISVYAHRLLFECMTAGSLRTVMAALDDEGIEDGVFSSIARPLIKSPAVGPIVFGKDPKTKVEMIRAKDDNIIVIDDSDDEYAGEEVRTRTDDTLDAFSTEGFLKLIENQGVSGVDTIYKNKIKPALYGGNSKRDDGKSLLQVSLLPHQIHGVCWMYQMETLDEGEIKCRDVASNSNISNPSLGLNGLLWERRRFREGDTYYYSPALGQARLTIGDREIANSRQRGPRGGILADEMGLGKTVQALALVLATLDNLRKEKSYQEQMEVSHRKCDEYYEGNDYKKYSHATLIIVPPALVGQWMNEIQKIAGPNIVVQFLDHKDQNESVALNLSADIVLTTYQAMESKGKKTSRKYSQSRAVSRILSSTVWGRIILDEMQEVRSWNTTTSKACQELKSDRRWMLSGTPLWEGIQDFKGELCFLGLEPFAANNEDGFFDFAIGNHWKARSKHGLEILQILSLVMLRRTKSMSIIESGLPLLGLKNLTLVFEPVPQDPPERAMYCFLESVMHSTLMGSGDATSDENLSIGATRKIKQNRSIFLRLLRELCVSPYLINGGLGCQPQISVLNRLMKEYNRKQLAGNNSGGAHGASTNQLYSCDEAIQFLSQVEDVARTDSDFVTDTRLGGGGGVSRRNRALLINPQEKVDEARAQILDSTEICEVARSARAKARWHWALEGVTTGKLTDKSCYDTASPSLVQLWNSRRVFMECKRTSFWSGVYSLFGRNQVQDHPPVSLLSRGFRPNMKYFEHTGNHINSRNNVDGDINNQQQEREDKLRLLGERHPEFRWAHPFAFHFSHIPIQVSSTQLRESIEDIFHPSLSLPLPVEVLRLRKESNTWEAIVRFSNRESFVRFEKHVKRVDGVPVEVQEKIPCIEQEIATAEAKLHEAEAMYKVHPCESNERNLAKARANYKKYKRGLRILDKAHHRPGQVLCSPAFGNFRGGVPKTYSDLIVTAMGQIEDATYQLTEHTSIIDQQTKRIKSLRNKMESNLSRTGVENLNTIDVLQALKNDEAEKTNCPICYDNLGNGESSNGLVLLTRCGHMSCKSCLGHWINEREAQGSAVTCIECRKPICRNQLICVDPKKVGKEHLDDRKRKATTMIQQAAKMLEENYGQLEPHLWEALYLVIDLPNNIGQDHHRLYTAIPGLFLGHLKAAMEDCIPIESGPKQESVAMNKKFPLPSKFRVLLNDLPRDELSVVFASSKSIVLHLKSALEMEGFGCKTLFVGQSEKESESAVSDWKSFRSEAGNRNAATVLIVQAGAAACGLTLTAASKMFIIEPFRKHEEEKQAYARLHRFGQKKAVFCKVYYTPVSVESRLLEWRRRAKTHAPEEEETVYAPLRHVPLPSPNNLDGTGQTMEDNDNDNNSIDEDENGREQNSNGNDHTDTVAEENQTRFLLGLTMPAVESE